MINIPKNGRIAIIDDKIAHAMPIIRLLSKYEMPHSYFSNDLEYLPEPGTRKNDIRILFLDINLLGDGTYPRKTIRATLVGVLSRVISPNNFPYVIIYWSRHEDEYKELIEQEIFNDILIDRKPIGFLSLNKLDFFDLEGSLVEGANERMSSLLNTADKLISEDLAHSYLIQWENLIHYSGDITLQEVFSSYHEYKDWSDNANFILDKLGLSYSGKTFFSLDDEKKIQSSYHALNNVFLDSLETLVNKCKIPNAENLTSNSNNVNKESIYTINRKLLTGSHVNGDLKYPGTIIENKDPSSNGPFAIFFNHVFNRFSIDVQSTSGLSQKEISKERDKIAKKLRRTIRETWKKIYLIVTPLCDYVQCKSTYNRVVQGVLIEAKYRKYLDNKSEAIFISPEFLVEDKNYIVVLHFRYFFTAINCKKEEFLTPIFRFRQEMLAEIQSKLARHISRQGILFLE